MIKEKNVYTLIPHKGYTSHRHNNKCVCLNCGVRQAAENDHDIL